MSRIIYPAPLHERITLLGDIMNMHASQPDILTLFLTEQKISLAHDQAVLAQAWVHHEEQQQLLREKEAVRQERDNNYKPAWSTTRAIIKYLKALKAPYHLALGEWGVPVLVSGRIKYPSNIQKRIDIFLLLKQKHDSYAAGASPLQPYLQQHNIDMAALATKMANAQTLHDEHAQMMRQVETETQECNRLQKPVMQNIRSIGGFLKPFYGQHFREIGLWGFNVVAMPHKARLRTTRLRPGFSITSKGVVLRSPLTNKGKATIHLHRGKKISTTPVILLPGESWEVQKGYSVITVENVDSLEHAVILRQIAG